jgi:hypothetical protein
MLLQRSQKMPTNRASCQAAKALSEPVPVEELAIRAERNASFRADLRPAPEVRAEALDRGRVERQPSFLVNFGVLDDPLASVVHVAAGDEQVGFLPSDVGLPDRDELAAARAGDDRHPQKRPEVWVTLPGNVQQPGDLRRIRRLDIRPVQPPRARLIGRVSCGAR